MLNVHKLSYHSLLFCYDLVLTCVIECWVKRSMKRLRACDGITSWVSQCDIRLDFAFFETVFACLIGPDTYVVALNTSDDQKLYFKSKHSFHHLTPDAVLIRLRDQSARDLAGSSYAQNREKL